MNDPQLISVIVPVGSVDEPLADQLRCILDQRTERPFEVVLARNTSDRDAEVALDALVASVHDPRIRVVPAEDRRGAAHARNVGAAAAHGEVLAFCDSDDRVHPGWLDALVDGLAHHDAVGGHLIDVTPGDSQSRPPATPDALPTFLGVPYIVSASLAIRRDHLLEAGGFDEDLVRCEDIALSWTLLSQGRRLGYIAGARADYRHRTGLALLVRQHYMYGQGMSQVLARYEVPEVPGATEEAERGWRRLVRANGQPGATRSWVTMVRRGSLAAGRAVGLAREARLRPTGGT